MNYKYLILWPWCFVAITTVIHRNLQIGFGRRESGGLVVTFAFGLPLERPTIKDKRIACGPIAIFWLTSEDITPEDKP